MGRAHVPAPHPDCLPEGTVVGNWRVVRRQGQGTYGAVYRVVPEGQESAAPVALKLALYPWDPRFVREVVLLSRIQHPSVPSLRDHGFWRHPSGAAHPYFAMEWVEGTSLYAWARESNPTSRQVLQLLAQLARALQATHAAGAVHRDVKGDNVLVRREDRRAFLTDFGAGNYPGAVRLTWQSLPPGTPAYRSPEAWRFLTRFGFSADAHYEAGPGDDLFALGVAAYRLVTGEYPSEEGHLWLPNGAGARPPLELNPRVVPQLSELILRMLAVLAEARGTAGALAEDLELAAERSGLEADHPLFVPESSPPAPQLQQEALDPFQPPWDMEEVRSSEQPAPTPPVEPAPMEAQVPVPGPARARRPRLPWFAVAAAGVLLLLWAGHIVHAWVEKVSAQAQAALETDAPDAGTSAVGDTSLTAPLASAHVPASREAVALDESPKLFPGQRKPDAKGQCPDQEQVAINGGCWVNVAMGADACERNGYVYLQGKCYAPSFAPPRKPTSEPGEPR
ncbi:serine/threonine protein kinase [Hyalangium rubrum]|uniref:Protein kinase n=1 Tax=Hyalangium rubrum TaxID=3103134 RepID=A0ABU5H9Y9_9BACT|nr:protein kinase [Hyalangium sp. s54d21]MDY7230288.1 protein kinase [Hyalangium sp. s54d21]